MFIVNAEAFVRLNVLNREEIMNSMNTMKGRKNGAHVLAALIPALALLGCMGGDDGKDGVHSSIRTTVEPAGENCANGGIKIEVLLDGEVQNEQTQYICNGNNGANGQGTHGADAAIQTAPEPAGANCANGGIKIEVFLDDVLQTDQTQYICNGTDGQGGTDGTNTAIRTSVEEPGAHCANGGIKAEVFLDDVLQTDQTQYICNGTDGQGGASGINAAIRTSVENPGTHCANGGIKVEVLLDGAVQENETKYICNVENGQDGRDGCDGGYHYEEHMNGCIPNGFVGIPAGSFVLTHNTYLYHESDAVMLAAFALGKAPVSVEEFQKCVAAGACTEENYDTAEDNRWICNYNRGEAWLNHPMNCVYWNGAKEYCEWIGGRLPTEEEWEYAATHNGTEHLNTTYAFGNTLEHCVTANYFDSPSYCNGTEATANTYWGTAAIGTYSPAGDSPLGLVDMTGNVNEWTSSQYSASNYNKVLKGGGWGENADYMPIASRIYFDRGTGKYYGGMRCVMGL